MFSDPYLSAQAERVVVLLFFVALFVAVIGVPLYFINRSNATQEVENREEEKAYEDHPINKADKVWVFHDEKRGVTCWSVNVYGHGGGIHCLPDNSFGPVLPGGAPALRPEK